MQPFNLKFIVASVIFVSSVVANPADASGESGEDIWPTVQCSNTEPLTHRDGYCVPALSQGFKSSRDCLKDGGGYYYCVRPDQHPEGKCIDLHLVGGPNYEGGECFIIFLD